MTPRFSWILVGAAAIAAGCSSSSSPGNRGATATSAAGVATTTSTTASTVPTTASTVPSSPSTVYAPTTPQPSPDSAAAALISDWASGARAAAGRVAAPAAVATMFAQPYPSSYLQSRGCTDANTNPGTCTYANRQSGALYEIGVTRGGAGWYVSSVTVES